MQSEACQMVRDWLDGPRGINAWISCIPVEETQVVKPVDRIVCRATDPSLAKGKYPDVARLLVVQPAGTFHTDVSGSIGSSDTKDLKVAVTYVVRNVDAVSARAESYTVLRALTQSLLDLCRRASDDQANCRGVWLKGGLGMETMSLNEASDNATIMGVTVVQLQLRDTAAVSGPITQA
jgi:hypothetical protein